MADPTPPAPLLPETEIPPTCANCCKSAAELQKTLSKCSNCTTRYCSVECQKNDWVNNNHKMRCAPRKARKPAATSRQNPIFVSLNTLLGLGTDDSHYLHALSERDVYGHLIDCFRLRADDEVTFTGEVGGIYDEQDPRPGFMEFLDLAESRENLLPEWWNG
ncbi:Zinc finger MYND-type protein [Rutstroemia sp. NJR-2017a BVV2]|nr:Zinc finger MYND-type protein [Rutstroemia sp. NJR-2017a BVV2]